MNAFFYQNFSSFLIILLIAILVLFIGLFFIYFRLQKIWKRYQLFFRGSKAQNLEEIITEEIQKLIKTEQKIEKIIEKLKSIDQMAHYSIQKVGIIRFNPFQDTGGDQSFVLALLDAQDNGVVISSLFGRNSLRIYAKPIEKGDSSYPLSQEEKEAIKQAKSRKFKKQEPEF